MEGNYEYKETDGIKVAQLSLKSQPLCITLSFDKVATNNQSFINGKIKLHQNFPVN